MQSEHSQMPNSDLDSVLRDGGNAFSHRRAVRTLLGMPDVDGGNVTFARSAPAVGFRYTPQPWMGQPFRISEPSQDTGPSGFDDESANDPARSKGIPGDATPHHGPLEEQAVKLLNVPPQPSPTGASARYATPVVAHRAGHLGASIQHTPRPRDADATSEHDKDLGAAMAKVERPDEVLEEITIAVPGTSDRPLHFPALAPDKQDDRAGSTAEESMGADGGRGHIGARLSAQRRWEMVDTPSPLAGEGRDGGMSWHDLQPSQHPRPNLPRSNARGKEPVDAETVGLLHTNVMSSTTRDVAASIEQLRRTVQELAAKMDSRQARASDDTQRQQTVQAPPQAAPRVVIIRQTPPRSGPPRAFWERSYLSRLSWRTL